MERKNDLRMILYEESFPFTKESVNIIPQRNGKPPQKKNIVIDIGEYIFRFFQTQRTYLI